VISLDKKIVNEKIKVERKHSSTKEAK